jgi:hypothetical protein
MDGFYADCTGTNALPLVTWGHHIAPVFAKFFPLAPGQKGVKPTKVKMLF